LKNNLKILIIPSWFDITEKTPFGIFFKEQAISLLEHNRVYFLYFNFSKSYSNKCNVYRKNRLIYIVININPIFKLGTISLIFFSIYYFFKLNLKKRVDIIHAHSILNAGLVAYIFKFLFSKPYIITEHHTKYLITDKHNFFYFIELLIVNKANVLISVSNSLSKRLELRFKKTRWITINNLVNPNFLKFSLNKKNNSKFIISTTALLTSKKNINILIDSFVLLSKIDNNIFLNIIGDGPDKEKLINLAKEHNIIESVCFHGNLNDIEIIDILSNSDIFVLPSRIETFGIAIIEAMSLGLPVIVTRSGGPETYVNETNGIVIEPNSVKQLYQALIKMKSEYKNYNSNNIKNYILNHFSSDIISSKITNIYKSIYENNNNFRG
jgi:glycosyltransferase involved in cell wall biosynthesis